jgi:hypothetical protein
LSTGLQALANRLQYGVSRRCHELDTRHLVNARDILVSASRNDYIESHCRYPRLGLETERRNRDTGAYRLGRDAAASRANAAPTPRTARVRRNAIAVPPSPAGTDKSG